MGGGEGLEIVSAQVRHVPSADVPAEAADAVRHFAAHRQLEPREVAKLKRVFVDMLRAARPDVVLPPMWSWAGPDLPAGAGVSAVAPAAAAAAAAAAATASMPGSAYLPVVGASGRPGVALDGAVALGGAGGAVALGGAATAAPAGMASAATAPPAGMASAEVVPSRKTVSVAAAVARAAQKRKADAAAAAADAAASAPAAPAAPAAAASGRLDVARPSKAPAVVVSDSESEFDVPARRVAAKKEELHQPDDAGTPGVASVAIIPGPSSSGGVAASSSQAYSAAPWHQAGSRSLGVGASPLDASASSICSSCKVPMSQCFKPFDWICPACQNHCYARSEALGI